MIITEEDIPYSSAEKLRKFLINNYISQILLAVAVVTMFIAAIAGVMLVLAVAFFTAIFLALVSRTYLYFTGKRLHTSEENTASSKSSFPGNMQFKCIYEDEEKREALISTYHIDATDLDECDIVFITSDKPIQNIEGRYFFRKYQTIHNNIFLLEWHFDTEHFSLGILDLNADCYQTIRDIKQGLIPTLSIADSRLIMSWNEPVFKKRITISDI